MLGYLIIKSNDFTEELHPRDENGKFSVGESSGNGKLEHKEKQQESDQPDDQDYSEMSMSDVVDDISEKLGVRLDEFTNKLGSILDSGSVDNDEISSLAESTKQEISEKLDQIAGEVLNNAKAAGEEAFAEVPKEYFSKLDEDIEFAKESIEGNIDAMVESIRDDPSKEYLEPLVTQLENEYFATMEAIKERAEVIEHEAYES
jgi:hypothetical protein